MELKEAVAAYRQEHNLSAREFAKMCGLSHVQVIRIERGVGSDGKPLEPTIKTLRKLAYGMGISITEVIHMCKDLVVHWDADDVAIAPEKQSVIDKILMATPEQFSQIRSYVDFVIKG